MATQRRRLFPGMVVIPLQWEPSSDRPGPLAVIDNSPRRYWVGGTGNWSDTKHWANSSGGSGGASVPDSVTNVFVDANSGMAAGTIRMDQHINTAVCRNFTATVGSAWTWQSVTDNIKIYGSLTLEGGVTTAGGLGITFLSTFAGETITQSGASLDGDILFSGIGGWTLLGAFSTTGGIEIDSGTFNANGQNVTGANYIYSFPSVGATATLNMGAGTWTTADWEMQSTLVTVNAGTSTIKITAYPSGGLSFFQGGGCTYHNVWLFSQTAGQSTWVATDGTSNTMSDLKIEAGQTILFGNGTTTKVTTFTASGTAGHLITITSDTTATFNLVKTGGGTISCNYLNIQHSVATPATTWYAGVNSVNNQAVATAGSGWIFTGAP